MHIRTFRAPSLQQALAEIREQMGPDAAVLHTRKVPQGLLRWTNKPHVEVTAGLRDAHEIPSPSPTPAAPRGQDSELTALPESAKLRETVEQLSQAVQRLKLQSDRTPSPAFPVLARLQALGLDYESSEEVYRIAKRLCSDKLPADAQAAWPMVKKALTSLIRVGPPIRAGRGRRRIVALVGPTGVGKTTTIAKLAAGFRLQTGFQVGLLTIDTFRMGAVEQLRSYAQIMDLAMEVVEHTDSMQAALERLSDCDLVLIDTAGRSPRDQLHVKQLNELLSVAEPDEIHLVINATTSPNSAKRVVQGYGMLAPSGLILSKVDEVDSIASLIPILASAAPPLTYVTTGQSVPDDIERADAEKLTERFGSALELSTVALASN